MFYRAYDDDGYPVKCDNFFRWSKNGANEGEPIFVVGRPGRTDRLYTYEHLEYFRDYLYPDYLKGYNAIYQAYYDYYHKYPEKEYLLNRVMGWGNSRKSFAGRLAGLKNEFIMKKKKDFQNELMERVNGDPELRNNYGHLWNSIDSVVTELGQYSKKRAILRFNRTIRPIYYDYAERMLQIADQKKLSNEERDEDFQDANLNENIDSLFAQDFDQELNDEILKASLRFLYGTCDSSNPYYEFIGEFDNSDKMVSELKNMSKLINKKAFIQISENDAEGISRIEDPFINYVKWIKNISSEINEKVRELNNTLSVLNELLGEVIYYVYGDKVPPDATSTIRISDGVIKGYEYNGTIAPGKTTYYGLWDRYESFNKKTYPWGLHERWRIPPKELDLSIDIGFASTNDIVGGNSGSSVINKNKEVVGLVHDGNIESLAGHTIFLEENNRTVATDSDGLIESLKHIYKTERLVEELLNGKLE
jgi:hypothetical protein